MNAQCYRVIFNKARGMLMVVSEAARSQGKTNNPADGGSTISQVAGTSQTASQINGCYQGGQLSNLRSQLLLALGLATIISTSISSSAHADATNIVADRNAAAAQQAAILKSSNGTTQVNIQTPSKAGVSRNVFSQFDVGTDGAILNNSRKNAQTQLAGWVEGNPYLARGEARVILNEVNSSDPSRLSGYTEIAGGRAELVIANPAGITCAGCGFINASRTTLTTGQALMDQGKLTGFDVTGGKVRIDGDGMDSLGSDYAQIIAKTAEINAGVYAKNLDVITGSNQVSYEEEGADTVVTANDSTSNNNATNNATGVALDVSALGAMYAGKIRLIGTDKGMGVTNAGSIVASAGGLQLDNNGNLINSGSLIANQGKVNIVTKGFDVDNSGTIASSRDTATLNSSTLNNSGVISSRDTLQLQQTGAISNSGEISTGSFDVKATSLNNSGSLLQTGSGNLTIDSSQLLNKQGGIIGQDLYADASTPPSMPPSKTPPTTANNGSNVGTDDSSQPSETPAPLPVITRDGNINASNLTNTGSIYSNGKINVAADSVANQDKSSLAVSTLNIADNGSASNTDSRLQLDQIDWQLVNFDNSNSQITATNSIRIQSADGIDNQNGIIAASGKIDLQAVGQFNNTKGKVQSNDSIRIKSTALDNMQGLLSSEGNLSIDTDGMLINDKGDIKTNQNLNVAAKGYSNTGGTMIGVERATIDVFDDIVINSTNSDIQAGNLTIKTQGNFTNSDTLSAQNALNINAQNIRNQKDAELISNGTTALNAAKDIDNSGLINGANTYLTAGDRVNNHSNGRIFGDHIAISAKTLNNSPDAVTGVMTATTTAPAPVIAARTRLDIGVVSLNNDPNQARAGKFNSDFNGQAKILSNGELHIGGSLDVEHQAIGRATTVTNKGASIESVGDMSITTDTLNNVNADFEKKNVLVSSNQVIEYSPDNQTVRYDEADIEIYVHGWNDDWEKTLRTVDGDFNNYEKFKYDVERYEEQTKTSDASLIRAGGNLVINAPKAINDHSLVIDGLTLVLEDDPTQTSRFGFQNISTEGNTVLKNVNSIYYSYRTKDKTRSDNPFSDRPYTYENGPYTVADDSRVINTFQLPILNQNIDKTVVAYEVTDSNAPQTSNIPTEEIRSSNDAPTLPNSSLYSTNPDSSADYLIETDPAFANYKNWLSSDYMLDRLQLNPNITQKRLGDGYYEQQYIRDQIMMLTGRYYLEDYSNQDAQYQGLMDAGITTAQTLNLRPGIALTDDQVAKLTTDIVWLVQQDVTLADGRSQKVLVPKVYTRQAVDQIDGTGSLIAANNLDMQLTGELNNQGSIVGHQSVNINAANLTNANGGLIKGDYVQIGTANDLNNLGATIGADSAMQLDAGGDLNNQSLTYSTSSVKGASNSTRTGISQIASIYVGDGLKDQVDDTGNPLNTFVANVGGDTTFAAGRFENQGGRSVIDTKGDIKLDAVNVGYQTNSIGDANNYFKQGESTDIGSQLSGTNDLILKAGKNITGVASQITGANGTVGILADGNVDFTEGRNKQNLSTAVKTTDKGFLSKTTTQDRYDMQSDQAISSNIEGDKVIVKAGQDINFTGTNAISDRGTQLTASGDVNILAAENTSSESSFSQTKKSGLFGTSGGIGFTIGKQQTDDSNDKTARTHSASKVGAIDGNVIIDAGHTYQQTGSNLVAGMGADTGKDIKDANRGNTVVRAREINIDNALNVYTNQSESKFKQSGLTVSVSNSLVDNVNAIRDLEEAAGNTGSTRMKGMAGVAAVLKTKALAEQGGDALTALQGGNLKGVGNTRIQATIGSQKSQSNSSSYTEKSQGSSITTNNLALIATGAGSDSNIDINGSNLTVSNDALFQADNDFNVNGVAQNSNTRSNNKSSSTAIGGYASFGQNTSAGITASASRGKGYANSDSTTYANSQINVGSTTTFDIGNDVNIKGGVINTGRAQGTIGGDVNIESLQDTATYDSKQKNMGFSADIDIAGGGAGSSLSVNGGKTDLNANYQAVGEQSGIFANEADLVVEGKGAFTGAVFTTSEEAQANGKSNIVFKQGVTSTDIMNTTSYEGDAISVGLSAGKTTGKPQATMNRLGYGTDGDSDSSITKGGVSGYNDEEGIFTTENREALAGKLENSFDAGRVNEELGAQSQITKDFGKEAPKAVGDFANNRIKAIIADTTLSNAEKNEAISKWDEGGIYRVAAHTALGALGTGSVEGALTTGGVAAAAPTLDEVQAKLAKALIDKGMSEDIANGTASGVVSLTLLGAGTAAGLDTSSTVTATNVDANNRQLHPSEIKQLKRRAKLLSKGNKGLEEYWLNLLYGAAYAKVDAQGNKKYGQYKQGINNGVDASSQLGASLGDAYLADYKKAESIINEMSKNAKGIVYLKDNKGNRITDNKGNNIGFLNADNNQYNYNTLLTNTYPPSPPNGGTSLRSNDPRRNLGTALESQTRAAAGQVANVGSGATTPIHPEDYALLGYGAAKTVTNIAKNSIAKGAAAKATEKEIQKQRVNNNQNTDLNNVLSGNPNGKADTAISQKKKADIASGTKNPHYDTKHGPYTTLQQQYDRAMKGTNPETGLKARPANASKFFNSTDMNTAISKAEAEFARNPEVRSVVITFDRPVGDGFMGNTKKNVKNGTAGEYRRTNTVIVNFGEESGRPYTAFPNIEQGKTYTIPDYIKP